MEQRHQNREGHRSEQPCRNTFSARLLYGQQPVNENQSRKNAHCASQQAGEQQKNIRHMRAPQ